VVVGGGFGGVRATRDGDSLAHVGDTANAVVFEASPVGQVTITGSGADRGWPGRES
jgi:homoserine dehydrogenase